jgi:hypothetical protein
MEDIINARDSIRNQGKTKKNLVSSLDLVEPLAHDKAQLEAVNFLKKNEEPFVLDTSRKIGENFHFKGFHQRNMIIWTVISS